jgi:hypothetical protein
VTGTVAEIGDPVSEQVAGLRDSSDLEADLREVARAARPGEPAPGDALRRHRAACPVGLSYYADAGARAFLAACGQN